MPSNQAAWLSAAGHAPLDVKDAPYHSPGPTEIAVRTHAVAINPNDWHRQMHGNTVDHYPTISGSDVAGTVESVSEQVQSLKVGDRVIANAVCLTLGDKYAAFQRYVLCPENITYKIPESMSFEEAVVLPLAVNTAGLALFSDKFLDLPRPTINAQENNKATVIIYGGSSSVGSTAIQLAKASGLNVLTTASKANFDYCRALGANAVFDYKDSEWVSYAASELEGKELLGIFDPIATAPTVESLHKVLELAKSKAMMATSLPAPEGFTTSMVFGANMTFDDELSRAIWIDCLPSALANGSFAPKPNPLVAGRGLESIQSALDLQRKGVSASKVVVSNVGELTPK